MRAPRGARTWDASETLTGHHSVKWRVEVEVRAKGLYNIETGMDHLVNHPRHRAYLVTQRQEMCPHPKEQDTINPLTGEEMAMSPRTLRVTVIGVEQIATIAKKDDPPRSVSRGIPLQ